MHRTAVVLCILVLLVPVTSAHEAKDYTVILGSEGTSPPSVPEDVLVTTDRIFFMMVDARENMTQRILVDVEGDGNYEGSDDIASSWLSSACDVDAEGNKTEPSCEVTYSLELSPSNGLLPGVVPITVQHRNGTNHIANFSFTASFSEDVHQEPVTPADAPLVQNDVEENGRIAIMGIAISASLLCLFLLALRRDRP